MSPLVSIITVAYNSCSTIDRTIQSVKSQTYQNIEYIVIDGKSTDRTMDVVLQYPFITKAISEHDDGIYDAMNKGLAFANGKIIAFLNADDYYLNNHVVQKVVDVFLSADIDAVFGDVGYFSSKNNKKLFRRYSSKIFTSKLLKKGFMPAHPTLFLRKEIFDRYGKFDASYEIAGDFDFIARIFKSNTLKYRYLEEIFVMMQSGGVSTQGLKSTITLNKEIMLSCKKNGIKTSWITLLSRYPYKFMEFFKLKASQ